MTKTFSLHGNSKSGSHDLHYCTLLVPKKRYQFLSAFSLFPYDAWTTWLTSPQSFVLTVESVVKDSGKPFIMIAGNRWMFTLEGTLKRSLARHSPLYKCLTCEAEGWLWTISSVFSHTAEEWLLQYKFVIRIPKTTLQWWKKEMCERCLPWCSPSNSVHTIDNWASGCKLFSTEARNWLFAVMGVKQISVELASAFSGLQWCVICDTSTSPTFCVATSLVSPLNSRSA